MEQPQQPESGNDAAAAAAHPSRARSTGGAPSDETMPAVPPAAMSGTEAARQFEGDKVDELSQRAREAAEKLKPVAIAAEEITAQAVDLSVKGLTKLSAYLQHRHEERQQHNQMDQPPTADS